MSDNMPKILLFCATKKGYEVLKVIIKKYPETLVCVSTFNEVDMQESFSDSIITLCKSTNIPVIKWTTFIENPLSIIKEYKVDCVIAISWKYYIPLTVNEHLTHKLIIFHDSLLPKYRGFAPLPSAIINGEREVGISAIYAIEEIDHGDIILQKRIRVGKEQYIVDIIDRVISLYCDAIIELVEKLKTGKKLRGVHQNHSNATYSIWRNPEDCQINWNNSATKIYNLIRAVSYPYSGAFTFLEKEKVYVWKSEIIIPDLKFEIKDPGKIWELDHKGRPAVVCGKGLLKIIEASRRDENLLPIKKLRQRFYFRNEV